MKISKTQNKRQVQASRKSSGKAKPASGAGKGSGSSRADSVDISSAAMHAAGTGGVDEISAVEETTTSGPLPDPYETSKKMLEKELKQVFNETYLTS